MKQIWLLAAVSAAAMVHVAPLSAGDAVLYAAPEGWVAPVDFAAALATGETLVVLEQQVRMERGQVATYSDIAYRIDNPEALTKAGTLQLGWLPDKGDLTVHRIEIHRDGAVTDLLAAGSRYTVLRRETALERRSLDGALTATIAVPGLKVGDVLRFSQTITRRDQALGDAVQFAAGLQALPVKIGAGRVIVSWPKDMAMAWRAMPGGAASVPVEKGGYKTLTVALPLSKRPELPEDAPARFTIAPLLQVTSFTGWQDISKRMAPHFATEGTIAPGSALAGQVAAIAARNSDPRARAAAALQLVQDEIAYLLNGLNGGNYLPQSPAETWGNRFGDCKAKSLLLLAMLREMDIEAEAVLVRIKGGDALAELLPMPGDFDHMIVRARIDGRDYWLDGTDSGIRLDTMEEVPPFAYALPLRMEGADLIPVTQRWPTVRDRVTTVTYDYRAGLDLPVVYDATVRMRGRMGAAVRAQADNKDPDARLAYAEKVMKDLVGDGAVYDAALSYDEASGTGIVKAKGVLGASFAWERGRGSLEIGLPSTDMEFSPDRARAAWRDIPYAVAGPFGASADVTVLLPPDAGTVELSGLGDFEGEVAGVKVRRKASLTDGRLHITDDAVRIPAEIPLADFAAQRAAVTRLAAGDPVLRTGPNAPRYWEMTPAAARQRIKMLEPAYDAIIAKEPKEAWRWASRARLLQYGPDLKRALADFDKAIALEPSAETYQERSNLKKEMGDLAGALADARAAHAQDATVTYARLVADVLSQQGKTDEALAMLEPFELSGDEEIDLMLARADIMGEGGRKDAGWALLGEAEAMRPGDADVLNAQCWFMGNWSYRLDDAKAVCDKAVTVSSYGAAALDSRALVHYRVGDRAAARSDLQAALISAPDQSTSRYLRGLIALDEGQTADGERDIAAATRLYGGIEAYFARFGLGRAK